MPITTIAVSVDGMPVSLPTARYAIYLAKVMQARLVVIYVVDERSVQDLLKNRVFVEVEAHEYEKELKEQGEALLARICRMAENKGIACEQFLLQGVVHNEVVNKVKDCGAELLVMGKLKELDSRREVFFDQGERIFREAPCPVLVVQNTEMADNLYKEI